MEGIVKVIHEMNYTSMRWDAHKSIDGLKIFSTHIAVYPKDKRGRIAHRTHSFDVLRRVEDGRNG